MSAISLVYSEKKMTEEESSSENKEHVNLNTWFRDNYSTSPSVDENAASPVQLEANTWQEIRLFLSSSFIDTHAERDVIIKRVIPSLNRRLAPMFVRFTPVDLRWGVLAEESKDCRAIQKTCLNQIEECKTHPQQSAWFLGLRTQRYGWVMDEYMDSKDFNHPDQFQWIDELAKIGKHVSITSLECLHASVAPCKRTVQPTVFFYQRNILNPEDVESNLRWVFEFEYVPEDRELEDEVRFQYSKTKWAESYEEDRENLDAFLQGSEYIKYRKYDCRYEVGGAKITGGGGGKKMFGVGYVTDLEEFEKQMEHDLYEAVVNNFKTADLSDIKPYVLKNIPYENAMKEKAASFVGRDALIEKCIAFCSQKSEDIKEQSNVMIVHGEPGCGKSALAAALSMKIVQQFRSDGHFVFVHAVDTCPDSSSIVSMIKRLHLNLQWFARESLGEDICEDNDLESPADLKQNHVRLMVAAAAKNPDKLFVVLVDAVNQFNPALQAHKMWWLPANPPQNLRIIVTTLNTENDTFANACKVCPGAYKVPVEEMSLQDAEIMVTKMLAKYQKKLTTTDGGFLGNQMQALLGKNLSPLYLTAATQALRTYGIFEKLSSYIESLPTTIAELFKFLLDGWKVEYGAGFVQDVLGILCLSTDGILENTINDILSFVERQENSVYECTFSRIYESLKGFLAAGGGGHLRLFHDQLNKVVSQEILTPEAEVRLHKHLVAFHLEQIMPQLCEKPVVLPSAYYSDCLTRVVRHQIRIVEMNSEPSEDVFTHTLRDIYFLRERVRYNQRDDLLQEYVAAMKKVTHVKESKALKDWKKFALNYIPLIAKYPKSAYSMGIQQNANSYVTSDSRRHPANESAPVWTNIPTADDSIVFKYHSVNCNGCYATDAATNLVASSGSGKTFLYEADSGVLLQEVASGGSGSLYISTQTFWACSREGFVSVWSISNGDKLWMEQCGIGMQKTHLGREVQDPIVWIGGVGGGKVGTCSSMGLVTIIEDGGDYAKLKSWNTNQNPEYKYESTYDAGYQQTTGLIVTAHRELVKFWSLDGSFVRSVFVRSDGECQGLTLSPSGDELLLGFRHDTEEDENRNRFRVLYSINTETDAVSRVLDDLPLYGFVARYHPLDNVFITLTKDMSKVLVYGGEDKKLRHKLTGHNEFIRDVCFVPGREELVTAADDGSVLFTVPTYEGEATLDAKDMYKEFDEIIHCCGMMHTGEKYFTLSEWGCLRVWDVATSQCVASTEKTKPWAKTWSHKRGKAVAHPTRNCILVYTPKSLYMINADNCKAVSTAKVLCDWISGMKISPLGDKFVISTYQEKSFVFHISSKNEIQTTLGGGGISKMFSKKEPQTAYIMRGAMACCDINRDGSRVVNGGRKGVFLWDINTGQSIKTLSSNPDVQQVQFVYSSNSEQVMYSAGTSKTGFSVHIADLQIGGDLFNGMVYWSFLGGDQSRFVQLHNVVLNIYNLETQEVIHTLVDHRSKGFQCCLETPAGSIIAFNSNGMKYVLEYAKK